MWACGQLIRAGQGGFSGVQADGGPRRRRAVGGALSQVSVVLARGNPVWHGHLAGRRKGAYYSDEFRRQAVDLYESTPGATVPGIGDDLGVEPRTMRHWLGRHGTGKKTAADGMLTRSPLKPGQS